MTSRDFQIEATTLIDDLNAVCANCGLGNDGTTGHRSATRHSPAG